MGHFSSFWVSVDLGACCFLNPSPHPPPLRKSALLQGSQQPWTQMSLMIRSASEEEQQVADPCDGDMDIICSEELKKALAGIPIASLIFLSLLFWGEKSKENHPQKQQENRQKTKKNEEKRRKSEEKRRKTKKNEKAKKKRKKTKKMGKFLRPHLHQPH